MKCRHCGKEIVQIIPHSNEIGAWVHTQNQNLYCEGLVNRMAWPHI